MLEIKTYIKKKGIIKKNDNLDEFFILVNTSEVFKFVEDFCYMEGALEIIWNNELIIGLKQWDLIDQLWIYLIDAIGEILNGKKEISFWFPDQPIEVKLFDFSNGNVMLTIDNKKIFEEKNYLFKQLLDAASSFFIKMIYPDNTFPNELKGKVLGDIGMYLDKVK